MNKEQIKKDYLKGATYKEIQEKHNITKNQLIHLIQKNQWKRKSNRSRAQKGNKNSKGNKGGHAPKGNKNAVTTGEYESIFFDVLDEDEKNIFDNYKKGTKESIIEELKILTIREKRMLKRIQTLKQKNKDLTITKINKTGDGTSTEAKITLDLINQVENGLTRVQQAKRRALDLLYKIECDKGALVETPNQLEYKKNTSILDSINKQLLGGGTSE